MKDLFLYIDPGSGSYLLQVLIAALLGAAFWIKLSWWKIRSFFSGKKLEKPEKPGSKKD